MSTQNKPTVAEGLVLTVSNHHIAQSGRPPNLKTGSVYTSYFENRNGEQMVFQYDHQLHQGTLWYGDYSWEAPIEVLLCIPVGYLLSEEEMDWLQLVWQVATHYEPERVRLLTALKLNSALIALYEKYLADPELDHERLHLQLKKTILERMREQAGIAKRLAEVLKESDPKETGRGPQGEWSQ